MRSARRVYPDLTPASQINFRLAFQNANQIRPGGISISKVSQILPHACAKLSLAGQSLQLLHHNRRFVVNDIAVERPRLVQILQVLTDRIGALRSVDDVSTGKMPDQKIEVMVDLGKARVDDLGSHEICEHFFGPHVIEPIHSHQIPEPHVCCFMSNQTCSAQELGLTRLRIQ